MNDYWIKSLRNSIPYLELRSLRKERRHIWPGDRHSHAVSELHIILQGRATLEIDDEVLELREGQAILIHPDTFHCNKEISETFTRFSISFLIREAFQLRDSPSESYFLFSPSPTVIHTCYDILEECDRGDPFWRQEMLSALLSRLMILIVRTIRKSQPDNSAINYGEASVFHNIDRFFSISNSPVAKDYSRKALAKELYCSERQLNRLIYSLYGMTFQEKRQLARMDYAKFLLRNTRKTVNEIANLIGYANESSFYKLFRANAGMTPQEFRSRYLDTKEADL